MAIMFESPIYQISPKKKMLYDKFFTSDQPSNDFHKGTDEFVTLLQVVIEEVYPEIKYKVTSSDSIHFLV